MSTTATSDDKPLVYFSASSKNYDWRDRLKQKLDAFSDVLQWWDDSRIETGNAGIQNYVARTDIAAAIERASIAVVLLSPSYIASKSATGEFGQLSMRSQKGLLKLIPVVLRKCEWQTLSPLQEKMLWSQGKEVLNGDESRIEQELQAIAEAIVNLATPEVTPDPGDKVSDDSPNANQETAKSQLQFSTGTEQVLKCARDLAERSKRAGVSSSCLLFAFSDLAETKPGSVVRWLPSPFLSEIGQLIRDSFNRGHQTYEAAFQQFMSDTGSHGRQAVADGGPVLGRVSANVQKTLERAAAIAEQVSGLLEIGERHLFVGADP